MHLEFQKEYFQIFNFHFTTNGEKNRKDILMKNISKERKKEKKWNARHACLAHVYLLLSRYL